MSIVTDRREREDAIERLSNQSTEALERDLIHWELAALASGERFHQVGEELQQLPELPRRGPVV